MSDMHSGDLTSHIKLHRGKVMHARLRPKLRRFTYSVFWLSLRLDQDLQSSAILGINSARPLSIRWRDYGLRDGNHPLAWVRATLAEQGIAADGMIWLHTFPRIWGYVFNPVSFYHCHDASGHLRAVLVAVNNTFGDWHIYVISTINGGVLDTAARPEWRKLMHVSPFCAMQGHYQFQFGEQSTQIDYHDNEGLLIKTAISGNAELANSSSLIRALLSHPLQSFGVMLRIHWQALRLWLSRHPFHRQPGLHRGGISRSDQENPL